MKCRHCGGTLRTIATRESHEGYITKRTKQCPLGHRYATFEVDDDLAGSLKSLMRSRTKFFEGNAIRFKRNQTIRRLRAEGWSLKRLSAFFHIVESTVVHVCKHTR